MAKKRKTVVTIRTREHASLATVVSDSFLSHLVYKWSYRVRSRARWSRQSPKAVAEIQSDAVHDLDQLGVTREQLLVIAKSGVVEISFPLEKGLSVDDPVGHYHRRVREFPWEYVINAATKDMRGEKPLCVVRHLQVKSVKHRKVQQPQTYFHIEMAPGELRTLKTFDAERELIKRSLGHGCNPLDAIKLAIDPTKTDLRKKFGGKEHGPDVVHVSAIDCHRAHNNPLLQRELKKEADCNHDGLFVGTNKGAEALITPEEFGRLVTQGDPHPMLVGLNCWHSGTQLAPMCIAQGAGAAIGFQNSFDDFVAEFFFKNFYQAWLEDCQSGDGNTLSPDPLSAFLQAWASIRPFKDKVKGTGIILWSATSLVSEERNAKVSASLGGIRDAEMFFQEKSTCSKAAAIVADCEKHKIKDLVGFKVKPFERLNYSMLHNQRSLVDELYFWLKFPEPQRAHDNEDCEPNHQDVRVEDIEVEVQLMIGGNSFPYRTRIALSPNNPSVDLADTTLQPLEGNPGGGVRVPLIADLARSNNEKVLTSLFINVEWHGQTLYRHTHSVFLTPTDEWSLNDEDICWLPSFVQPRDPAIRNIIESAQGFLKCLMDDPTLGFVGYQADAETVEAQVKAIWAAITYECKLNYICPPPAYSPNAQRLRTPTQVIDQNHGTCVDLALLFVSCLEWIELYPVIFQTEIHAFAGYWATEKARDDFLSIRHKGSEQTPYKKPSLHEMLRHQDCASSITDLPWITSKYAYDEIRQHIYDDQLVPVECVSLTENSGFARSWLYAKNYFSFTKPEIARRKKCAIHYLDECKDACKLAKKHVTELTKELDRLAKSRTANKNAKLKTARAELAEAEKSFKAEKEYLEAAEYEVDCLENYEYSSLGEINPKSAPHEEVDNFHSMIDICSSRAFVTPLPLSKNGHDV